MTGAPDVAGLVPDSFVRAVTPSGAEWAARLPRLLADTLTRWDLDVDGPTRHGTHALAVPVRQADTTPAVLRLDRPRPETAADHVALRSWSGYGAATLLAADPHTHVQLLERLDADTDLTSLPPAQACAVVGRLLARLDRPPLARIPNATTHLDTTADLFARARHDRPVLPRRFVDQAASLLRDLRRDGEPRLTPTALRFTNVLAARGERTQGPWAAISPAALGVETAYGVWPVLTDIGATLGGDVSWEVHCRLGAVCDAARVDEDRARAWAIVRTVEHALRTATHTTHPHRPTPAGSSPRHVSGVTDAVTLVKALQRHA